MGRGGGDRPTASPFESATAYVARQRRFYDCKFFTLQIFIRMLSLMTEADPGICQRVVSQG